jgi:hypothetical protein
MIEAYAFVAMFALQIVALSVLYPTWFNRYVRVREPGFPAEYFAQMYPGIDRELATARFLSRYRAANTIIAVLGAVLLGWLFNYMRRAAWDESTVIILHSIYSAMQFLPILIVGLIGFRHRKVLSSFAQRKRKATLQPRGIFDCVSPFAVFVALGAYCLFVVSVIYFQPKPFPGFALIGVLTLTYALQIFTVYRQLYGRKANPFETHAARVHTIGQSVRAGVYGCIVCVVFFSFIFTVELLDMKTWVPFAQSLCLVLSAVLCIMGLTPPPRPSSEDGIHEGQLTR